MPGKVTIRDVAREAGVALGTVSRVLNGHRSVGREAERRVREAVARLGYRPDGIARSMRMGSTRTIACAIRDISTAGFGDFVKAAEAVLRERGYTLILANTDDQGEREVSLVGSFRTRRVDGIVMTLGSETDEDLLRALAEARLPVVLMDRDAPASFDVAAIDHRHGARLAMDHLCGLGHRDIALITGQESVRPARERLAGYREALLARGIAPDEGFVRSGGFSGAFGFEAMSDLLARRGRPTAVLTGGMAMLPGVLRAIRQAGLRVPRDISVVAGADTDLSGLFDPPITAVHWDNAAWGRGAIELLLDRIDGAATPPRRILIPTALIERGSTGAPSL